MVAIPRRQVDAKFEPSRRTSLGELGDDIALTVAPRAVFDRMGGVLRGPQTKAVVVLGGKDEAVHAATTGAVDDLGGIEITRIENCRGFVAQTPFAVGKGVDGKVQKPIKLVGVPGLLARRWHGAKG